MHIRRSGSIYINDPNNSTTTYIPSTESATNDSEILTNVTRQHVGMFCVDRDGRISKVTEAQKMTSFSSTESSDRFRLMTNAPPKDLATLQEQVKRMKEQAAVAAQRTDDVQAVEIAASTMKAS